MTSRNSLYNAPAKKSLQENRPLPTRPLVQKTSFFWIPGLAEKCLAGCWSVEGLPFSQDLQPCKASEVSQTRLGRAKGGGKTYRKAKPREDGPLETIFRDPPKLSVPRNRNRGKIAAFSNRKVLNRRFCRRNRRKIAEEIVEKSLAIYWAAEKKSQRFCVFKSQRFRDAKLRKLFLRRSAEGNSGHF